MATNQPASPTAQPQATALMMARWVHDRARAVRTYLFGSRARGDHNLDSDIDILIITDELPEEAQLDIIREEARQVQMETMPEASGVDVLAMTLQDFQKRRRLINNLAWTIDKEGIMAVGEETLGYGRHATKVTKTKNTIAPNRTILSKTGQTTTRMSRKQTGLTGKTWISAERTALAARAILISGVKQTSWKC